METIITVFHIVFCLFLILIVLLQAGKGADLGATFGGSSQTLFGSRGAATFLSKITAVSACGFMITSLAITYIRSHSDSKSVMDTAVSAPTATPAPTPAVTVTPQAPTPAPTKETAPAKPEKPKTPAVPAKK